MADDDETFVDEHGTVWKRPTAWAYYAACRALGSLREQLREAGIEPRGVAMKHEPREPQ